MTSKLVRDVMRRPTLVTYGSDHQPRLLPLLEYGMEETPDSMDANPQANDAEEAESTEDKESLVNSDDYDTDLDGEETNPARPTAAPVDSKMADDDNCSTGAGDFGEAIYTAACEQLHINRVQRVIDGLSTTSLNLKYRCLGPLGAKALAAALNSNGRVETLDLEENALGGEGTGYIADMLRDNNTITGLNLSKNDLGHEGAVAVGNLLENDNELLYLDLSDNNFGEVDAEPLAIGIERNERVTYLNLSHNDFGQEAAIALGRAIGTNNAIEILDLSWNQMRKTAAVLICSGLKRNYCLTSVNLSWNGFDYEGSVAVCEMLRGNKYLREVDVSHNRINWEGAMLIAKGLKENDTLEILYLGGNPLTMTGVLDILESVDNTSSVISYIGFDDIPVNRKIVYMMESIQKYREFSMVHGGLLESEDVLGRRMVLRCDPLKLLIQFMTDKNIRPVDLFRSFDKDKQYRVTREQFVSGLKKAQVPLDDYELEKVLFRLDAGKEGKISYQRLIKGVKEQIRINREEEKQKMLEEKNITDDHRKMLKMAAGLTNKVSFGSPRSSTPSETGERPLSEATSGPPTSRRPSNLTRANVRAVAAAAERKALQHPARRKTSFGNDGSRAEKEDVEFDRLNLDDDDEDDPDMMSLDNSMISGVDLRSERSPKHSGTRLSVDTSAVKNNHGRK